MASVVVAEVDSLLERPLPQQQAAPEIAPPPVPVAGREVRKKPDGKRKKRDASKADDAAEADSQQKDLEDDGRCTFFLPGKGRRCRFFPIPGMDRCGAHREDAPSDLGERIPCPLDPNHSVFVKRLKQHLKVCTKVREASIVEQQPFYKKSVNSGSALSNASGSVQRVNAAPAEVARAWMDRIIDAFPRAVSQVLGTSADAADVLERSVVEDAAGTESKHAEKHEVQNQALAGLAVRGGLTDSDVVVEFGCGKGGLAGAILEVHPGARCVLVDRESRRHKMENKQEKREERVLRLRLDIVDFDLATFLDAPLDPASLPRAADFQRAGLSVCSSGDGVGPAERLEETWKAAARLQFAPWPPPKVVACAKHLCGGATDVTLRALVGRGKQGVAPAIAACVATCCHQRCDPGSYVNVPFLESLGLVHSPEDFAQLVSMAGWAVGGRANAEDLARRRVGMMVKRILDLGRVAWMREKLGLKDATLAWYISKDVTPENVAIVAGS